MFNVFNFSSDWDNMIVELGTIQHQKLFDLIEKHYRRFERIVSKQSKDFSGEFHLQLIDDDHDIIKIKETPPCFLFDYLSYALNQSMQLIEIVQCLIWFLLRKSIAVF